MMRNDVLLKNPKREEVMSTNEETTMLSMGEQVVMQTAMVKVMPPDESTLEFIRVCYGCWKQQNLRTEEIVRRLKLKPTESDKLTIFTHGITEPKEFKKIVIACLSLGSQFLLCIFL